MLTSLLGEEQTSIAMGCHDHQCFGFAPPEECSVHTHTQDGIMDGFQNIFCLDALQAIKQNAEMCLFKAHLIMSWKSHGPSTG